MSYRDLRDFLNKLEEAGELQKIVSAVDPYLEISEITNRVSKGSPDKNKALLFENVSGYQIPVLINTLGSYKRMNLALGVNSFKEIGNRIEKFLDKKVPDSLLGKLSMLPKLIEVASFPPKMTNHAPCQEVVITRDKNPNEPMLDKLPVITAWPEDAAPFITMTVVVTKDPKTGIRNVGMYRLQKIDNNTTCMHWHKHHDGAQNYIETVSSQQSTTRAQRTDELGQEIEQDGKISHRSSVQVKERQAKDVAMSNILSVEKEKETSRRDFSGTKKMEVAVAIGCDPAVMYAASAPLPPGIDEFLFAGFLRSSPVELVKCKTVDLEVPATSEIVLEGYVDLDELTTEGPFGDHTGFYSMAGLFPKFHITAMTHRTNPIYTTIIVGKPPIEDSYMGKATEQIFLPLVRVFLPEVVDLNLPLEGAFHNCAIVSIKKKYPYHARKVMNAIWGIGQLMFSKYIVVVDDDVDVHNLSDVAFRVFANTDPKRDSLFTEGPTDILDHAATTMAISGKMGLDATRKWKSEGYMREWPGEMKMDEDTRKLVSKRWKEYGI